MIQCKDIHLWKYKENYYVFDVRIIIEDEGNYDLVYKEAKKIVKKYSKIKKFCFNIEDDNYRKEMLIS